MVAKKKRPVQSVERALDILDCLANHGVPMRSIDIAGELALHPSTANNLIRTLYRRRYLSRAEGGRYGVGIQCYVLGEIVDRWEELRRLSTPIIQRLSAETGDNSYIGVLADGRLLTIAFAEGTGPVIVSRKHAWAEQVHCTASGKILLAFDARGFDELAQSDVPLQKYTDRTITDPSALRKEIERIGRTGYSVCREEGCEGVTALGVPVFTRKDQFICALSQPFPTYSIRCGKVSVQERVALLHRYAHEIGNAHDEIRRAQQEN
jgi:DNA-binding IclR family transcriptional regulator